MKPVTRHLYNDFTRSLADYVELRDKFRRMRLEVQQRERLIASLDRIIKEHRAIVQKVVDSWN